MANAPLLHRSLASRCCSRLGILVVGCLLGFSSCPSLSAEPPSTVAQIPGRRPVTLRVQWGGGKPRGWNGVVRVVSARDGRPAEGIQWRTLCTARDAAAMLHEDAGIVVHETRPLEDGGVEAVLPDCRGLRLRVELRPADGRQAAVSLDVPVTDVLIGPIQRPLDADGNRLTVKQAAGDALRVVVENADGRPATLPRPGDSIRVAVDPLLAIKADHQPEAEVRLRIRPAGAAAEPPQQVTVLEPIEAFDDEQSPGAGMRPVRFRPVEFQFKLPDLEGVSELEIEAVERGSLRWSRTLASRTVQIAAVDDRPVTAADAAEWSLVHEVDPGSPRLHERLRRLPSVGLPSVPLPTVPLPSLTRPNVPLPKLPTVPVTVPSVTSMVPRFSGLLTSGHSVVEPHPLGAMLQLPPAADSAEPSWEGVVIAGVRPGMPHLVEIDYPSDQDAVVGLNVLELDAAERLVVCRHVGGFTVHKPQPYEMAAPRMETHRFVFWPTTRQPVILISNPSPRAAATVGRIRVLAGPARLPAAAMATLDPGRIGGIADPRRVHGFLSEPDFARFGGGTRVVRGERRAVVDWQGQLSGMRHSAELLAAHAAGGAMVVVHAQGGSLWPSPLTMHAPRWDEAAASEAGLDAAPKDMLAALCRVYTSAGLRLVPAVSFDAAVPSLERRLMQGGPEAVGIACVGRDGLPLRGGSEAVVRYNVLDPRVQAAVEVQIRELAGRVRGEGIIDGLAIVMSLDGWMHLPHATAGLDDVTFGRFLAAMGASAPPATEDRFAQRAGLVEGSLRDLWLEWRAAELATFHGRLADLLAEFDPRWKLYLVPTTVFSGGDLAAAAKPALAARGGPDDMLRELGLDPVASTAHKGVVFVFPHVHAAADELATRGGASGMNAGRSLAEASAACSRRATVLVERPLELDPQGILPHGPFGTATAAGPCLVHASPGGGGRDRGLVESLVAADAEIVFDMRMVLDAAPPSAPQRAFESLASGPLKTVVGTPAPLVVRWAAGQGITRVTVSNASSVAGFATLALAGQPSVLVDAVSGERLTVGDGGVANVPLGPWGMRTLLVDGDVRIQSAGIGFEAGIKQAVADRVASLRRRRSSLDTPQPLDVLDNPEFELGADPGQPAQSVPGWELVESRRGSLNLVTGVPAGQPDVPGRGLAFSSVNGLSTLRSNPFTPPATGRLSVSVWLRIKDGDPQPPLRLALEGVLGEQEFYRFAAVGGLAGGRPLTTEWSRYVLQMDDLPTANLESLRVRFDLLGPGSVQIDQVQLFDLAFDESQRVQLSRRISRLEQHLAEGRYGECLVALDGYWPRFLETFVTDPGPERMAAAVDPRASPTTPRPAAPEPPKPAAAPGMLDRLRSWWQ